jgi:hypothetical protein
MNFDSSISVNEASLVVPTGFRVSINGGVWHGGSPALTLLSGTLTVSNATFANATDAPTILVTGGSLTLRNDVIQESTGFTDAAIAITGGTLDLGTAASPGGNTINVNGTGELVHNTTSNSVPATGDTFSANGVALPSPFLSFTTLSSSAGVSVYGQAVTFTATVRGNPPASDTPTGTVDFFDVTTNTDLGTVPLSGGTASLNTSALAVGGHTIQAVYSGDSSFLFSCDALAQTVNQDTTTTAVSSSANPSLLNQAVTFTAVVSANAPGSGTPTGTVQFQVDGINVGSPVMLVNGRATWTTPSLPAGPHTITAVYSGDGNFLGCSGQASQAVHYHFGGFQTPLTPGGSYSLGRTLPITWQLTDANGSYISSLSAVQSLQVQSVNAQGNPLAPPFSPAASGGTALRYDPTGHQYIFNWDTKGLKAGYYEIELTLADGTVQTLVVRLG